MSTRCSAMGLALAVGLLSAAPAAGAASSFVPCGQVLSPDKNHRAVLRLRPTPAGEQIGVYLCDNAYWCDELAYVGSAHQVAVQWGRDGSLLVSSPALAGPGSHRDYPEGGGRPRVQFTPALPRVEPGNEGRALLFDRSRCQTSPPISAR